MNPVNQTKNATFEETVHQFLHQHFPSDINQSLSDTDPLPSSEGGFLDSLGIQMLLSHFEETLEIELEEDDLIPETFQSVKNFASVLRKRSSHTVQLE